MTEGNGEVRELPKGWVWTNASIVCSSVRDGTHDTPKYVEHGIPLVTSKNLKNGQIDFSTAKLISYEDHCQISIRSGVEPGDVLFAMIGTIGNPVVIQSNQEFSIKNVGLFKKNESAINSYFLKFWLSSHLFGKISEEKQLIKGTTQKFIPLGNLRALPLPLPPFKEQERIVEKIEELFSDLDQGIESLKTAQKQLKVYRQAVLKWAFEGKLTEEWRKQHSSTLKTGEALLAQIKAERENCYQQQLAEWEEKVREWEAIGKVGKKPTKPQQPREFLSLAEAEISGLPKIPNDWCWAYSSELFAFVTSGSRGWAQYYSDKGSIFIRITNLDFNSLNLDLSPETIQYVNLPDEVEGMRTKVQENDFLFSITGYLGMFALVPKNLPEAYVNQHIALARPCENLNYRYLGYYFISEVGGIRQFQEKQKGATKAGLTLDDIQTAKIPFPSPEEQEQIVQEIELRLSTCDQLEAIIIANLQKAEALRQSILKQAFEGKLVPQDPNDEPAEKLLERIKAEKAKQQQQRGLMNTQLNLEGV